jgi:serine/threonine protein kinase
MVVRVRCPNPACGQACDLGEDGLGRVFRCPRCGTKLVHPASANRRRWLVTPPTSPPAADKTPRPAATEREAADGFRGEDSPPAGRTSEPASPAKLGRFQVRTTLGSGAFATTYRAYDPYLDRDVALKVLRAGHPQGSECIDHILSEAKTLARLRHPGIVPIFEAGRDGMHQYIAMPFIEGHALSEVIAGGPIDFRCAARIVGDVAEALAHAHGLGIVHRDVKPANILLAACGAAHLMDFGLAHRRDSAAGSTRDYAIFGTPAYIAPEQARDSGAVPLPASDQYSLGVVLYELLCGRPPFSGPPLVMLISAIHDEPPRPRSLNSKLPRELEAICLKALAKRPTDRYASCQDLAEDLRRWLGGEAIAVYRPRSWERAKRCLRRVQDLAATVLS